jgi:hypothetical protein
VSSALSTYCATRRERAGRDLVEVAAGGVHPTQHRADASTTPSGTPTAAGPSTTAPPDTLRSSSGAGYSSSASVGSRTRSHAIPSAPVTIADPGAMSPATVRPPEAHGSSRWPLNAIPTWCGPVAVGSSCAGSQAYPERRPGQCRTPA